VKKRKTDALGIGEGGGVDHRYEFYPKEGNSSASNSCTVLSWDSSLCITSIAWRTSYLSLLEYAFLWRKMLSLHTFRSKRENRENLQLSARAVWQIAVLLLESLNYIQINCIVIPPFARNYKENTYTPTFQAPPPKRGTEAQSPSPVANVLLRHLW
jgi:hypothetical protein